MEDGAELPEELHQLILHNFEQLIERSGWGNARDVNTVYDDMRAERERRLDNEGVDSGPYIESDMKIFTRMIAEREEKDILLLDRNAAPDEALYANDAVQSYERRSVRNMPKQVEIKMEAILAEEGPAEKTVQEALSALTLIDPNDLWSSLDEALTEMGYDIYSTAIILSKGKLPEELVALVAKKVASTADRVRPMLEAQCPSLLLPVLALIEKIKKELEIQRKAQDDMAKADEAERERLRIIEKLRQKEAVLERVQMIGKCCMGYEWIKIQDGYQCAGGSHFVSDAQVNLV